MYGNFANCSYRQSMQNQQHYLSDMRSDVLTFGCLRADGRLKKPILEVGKKKGTGFFALRQRHGVGPV
jgi:predicted nucleic acid-binding Zn ribbon protein